MSDSAKAIDKMEHLNFKLLSLKIKQTVSATNIHYKSKKKVFPITEKHVFHTSIISVDVPSFTNAWQTVLNTEPWQSEYVIARGSEHTPAGDSTYLVAALTRADVTL